MPGVSIDHLSVTIGGARIIRDVSFAAEQGELISLLGPSGCGKSTILRAVAGLTGVSAGQILVGDTIVTAPERGINVPPEKRELGMVFQSYAIWPHMTVAENVAYPLVVRSAKAREIKDRVSAVMETVGLQGLADRPSTHLSGGQQQRIALARALVFQPKLLLLDEPLSNLDSRLRAQMGAELRRIQRQTGVTAIFVTHDQGEALALSDRVVVMRDGAIEQIGTPQDIYQRPSNAFVSWFVGRTSFLPARIVTPVDGQGTVQVRLDANGYLCQARVSVGDFAKDEAVLLGIRPEQVILPEPGGDAGFPVTIASNEYFGDRWHNSAHIADRDLAFYSARAPGDIERLAIAPGTAIVFKTGAFDPIGR
jgi:iron(III) transport system ATP-binding protein